MGKGFHHFEVFSLLWTSKLFGRRELSTETALQDSKTTENYRKVIMRVVVLKTPIHPSDRLGQAISQSTADSVSFAVEVNSAPVSIDMALNQFFQKLHSGCKKGVYQNIHLRPDHFTTGIRENRVDMNFDVSYHWQIDGYTVLVSFTAGDDE